MNHANLIQYWQAAAKKQFIANLTPEQIMHSGKTISKQELQDEKLSQSSITGEYLIAPIYAQKTTAFFVPYVLHVFVEPSGGLKFTEQSSLPIVLNCNLEPSILNPILLGSEEQFAAYLSANDLPISWHELLSYAEQMLEDITKGAWKWHLSNVGYALQPDAIICSLDKIYTTSEMNIYKLNDFTNVDLIEIEDENDRQSVISRVLANDWIESALKQGNAPRHVVVYDELPEVYAKPLINKFWIEDGIENFLSYCSNSFSKDLLSLQQAQELSYIKLKDKFNIYIKGKQCLRNYHELTDSISIKYSATGGLNARINELQKLYENSQAEIRHLNVLNSIWQRQLELIPKWPKILDFIPSVANSRMSRLHEFFKQNFPDEDISKVSQEDLKKIMAGKLLQAEKSKNFIADMLHQSKSEQQQLEISRAKCVDWGKSENHKIMRLQDVERFISQSLWDEIILLTSIYWHSKFLADDQNHLMTIEDIEILIFARAEYTSPMVAAQIISKAKKIAIIGSYMQVTSPRFSVAIDQALVNNCSLLENNEDIEDLDLDGYLGSTGNLWKIATSNREPEKRLAEQSLDPECDLVPINGKSDPYLGSRINRVEAEAIMTWILENESTDIVVYTSFSAQANHFRIALNSHGIYDIPVLTLRTSNFLTANTVVFSPVYTSEDKGPYYFDRGVEILDSLVRAAQQKLIVFGDQRLFNPKLHSASGIFARRLFAKKSLCTTN